MTSGWKNESQRHALASKGIKTGNLTQKKVVKSKQNRIFLDRKITKLTIKQTVKAQMQEDFDNGAFDDGYSTKFTQKEWAEVAYSYKLIENDNTIKVIFSPANGLDMGTGYENIAGRLSYIGWKEGIRYRMLDNGFELYYDKEKDVYKRD